MSDTPADIAALQAAIHARMTPVERLETAIELSDLARALALARLRAEHPEWPESRLRLELLRIALLPDELPPALR